MAFSVHFQHNFKTDTDKKDKEKDNDNYKATYEDYTDIIPTLPKEKGWMSDYLLKYQGVWLTMSGLKGVMLVQQHFRALPTDILLATFPKSGTTWLKALIFTILNRACFDFSLHPLLTNGPHDCILFLEAMISQNYQPNLTSPRIFATHIPYPLLPASVEASTCRIVYLFRDPKDVLVSSWYYLKRLRAKGLPPLSLEEAFEMFSEGISHFGPFWDHVIGYWNASLYSKKKVLFLTYEEMKVEPSVHVKRLAEFLGCPFSLEEEREGILQEIIRLCSFENLSNLDVNQTGVQRFTPQFAVENRMFFRKGKVGDWKNHLTAEMIERLDQITEHKFSGTGLIFQ